MIEPSPKIERIPWHLLFEKVKEERFLNYAFNSNIGFLRRSFQAVTVLAGLFAAVTYTVQDFVENDKLYVLMLAFLFLIPLSGLYASYTNFFRRNYSLCLSLLVLLTCLPIMAAIDGLPSALKANAGGAILFLLLVNFGLLRQRWIPAVLNGTVIAAIYFYHAWSNKTLNDMVFPQQLVHFALFLCGGAAVAWHIEASLRHSFLAKELIEHEHGRAEALLLNILPLPIASRLKSSQTCIADGVQEVAVLFADIVGFSQLTKKTPAEDLVMMLDSLFSEFDLIMERHRVEKIKTIGDSYMAAAGLLDDGKDNCFRLADAALEILALVADKYPEMPVRIGMHCGPVVAGVIGRKKMIYDLWGDTVNIASRMESNGVSGSIQISEPFFQIVKDHYETSALKTVSIKGQGDMQVAFLRRRL